MFVLARFGHVVGVLILFAAFALEWVILGERPELASVLPRLHGTAGVVLVLTGSYIARQLGVWRDGWIAVSLASLVILAIGGMGSGARMRALGTSSRGDAWLVASLRVRLSVALGVVYLMVATPDFALSITVVAAAALVGAAVAFPVWRAARGAAASRKAASARLPSVGASQSRSRVAITSG